MVGHTGHLQAAILAMNTIDLMLNRLLSACKKNDTILMITADHGNCEEMFHAKEKEYPLWQTSYQITPPPMKTSHTLSKVPFIVFDPKQEKTGYNSSTLLDGKTYSLANIANTILQLMGIQTHPHFEPSILKNGN